MKHDVMIQIFSNNKQKNFLWSKRRTEKHVIFFKKRFLVKDRVTCVDYMPFYVVSMHYTIEYTFYVGYYKVLPVNFLVDE